MLRSLRDRHTVFAAIPYKINNNVFNFHRNIYLQQRSFTMKETTHLAKDSSQPSLNQGVLRIYNMRFCPYAQRSLLVAEAKKIPYDVVNINLFSKPDWFLALNPRGQVPTLQFEDDQTLSESNVVSEYLEETYPNSRPLYPRDLIAKAKDRMLIERFNGVIALFYQLFKSIGNTDVNIEVFEKLVRILQKYEKELVNRGTSFFAGDSPGMVDYMIWPWFEREGILQLSGNDKLKMFNNSLPQLNHWCEEMRKDDAVKKWVLPVEIHVQFLIGLFSGKPNYDALVTPNKL